MSKLELELQELLKTTRKRIGLNTIYASAEALGVAWLTVNRWENGKSIPSLVHARNIIDTYGLNYEESERLFELLELIRTKNRIKRG